jgi:hypothetical protein
MQFVCIQTKLYKIAKWIEIHDYRINDDEIKGLVLKFLLAAVILLRKSLIKLLFVVGPNLHNLKI